MSMKLRELIRAVRGSKTAAEERAVVAKEAAAIRDSFKAGETSYRHRNIAKLLFIHMLGYPTHFGQMECVKLVASAKFSEKRIGYLGLSQLIEEDTEVLMLVTNCIKIDMGSNNQFVAGAALVTLGDLGTPEMCMVLGREVESLMSSQNPNIRKKATLCSARVIEKVEDLTDRFVPKLVAALEDKVHGVVLAACSSLLSLLNRNPSLLPDLKHVPSILIRCLKTIIASGYSGSAEYEFSGVTDPFLQVSILRLLGVFASASILTPEEMNDLLAQIATNTDGSRNAGNAILYECVNTIMSLPNADSGLRVLGVNILGRFLTNKDNNVRYVALATLQRVVSIDEKAVQRHRSTVLECLQDPDISIRRRALDVATALTNSSNVKAVVKEFFEYLLVAEGEFKEDLVTRICHVADHFAPDKRWYIDTIIRVMVLAGSAVRDGPLASFCHILLSTPDLQNYATNELLRAATTGGSESVLHAAVWCVGEFGGGLIAGGGMMGTSPAELLNFLEQTSQKAYLSIADQEAVQHQKQVSSVSSRSGHTLCEYVVTAFAKLSTRLPGEYKSRIASNLRHFDCATSAELQQRACEYLELLGSSWDQHRIGIFDKMPVSDKVIASLGDRAVGESKPVKRDSFDLEDLLGGSPKKAPIIQNNHDALLDILGPTSTSFDPLGDLISSPAADSQKGKVIHERNGLRIELLHTVQNGVYSISAKFNNYAAGGTLTNFVFEVAVPKYLKLVMSPASSSSVPAYGSTTQSFTITNSEPDKAILLKFRLNYLTAQGQPITDMGQVAGLE